MPALAAEHPEVSKHLLTLSGKHHHFILLVCCHGSAAAKA